MSVLHISFDFPDSVVSEKTKAVSNLIDAQTLVPNIVVSLNRTANPFSDFKVRKEPYGYAMNVFGLPFGIGLRFWMYLVSIKIDNIFLNNWNSISVIHAHKLTFEGIIGYYLSKKYNIPLIITVRGDSDLRVIKAKVELRELFKKVVNKANKIIFLAPWTKKGFASYFLNVDIENKSVVIPNIIDVKQRIRAVDFSTKNKFVSVFRLDSYKRKNIERIIKAIDSLHIDYPDISLDIIGSGSDKSIKIVKKYISRCKFPNRFTMVGKLSQDKVQKAYKDYAGLILPSKPETFGLVFIEALNAGIPIIYAANSGVDGFFDDSVVGFRVQFESQEELKLSIEEIFKNQISLFQQIEMFISDGGLDIFTKSEVAKSYMKEISLVLKT